MNYQHLANYLLFQFQYLKNKNIDPSILFSNTKKSVCIYEPPTSYIIDDENEYLKSIMNLRSNDYKYFPLTHDREILVDCANAFIQENPLSRQFIFENFYQIVSDSNHDFLSLLNKVKVKSYFETGFKHFTLQTSDDNPTGLIDFFTMNKIIIKYSSGLEDIFNYYHHFCEHNCATLIMSENKSLQDFRDIINSHFKNEKAKINKLSNFIPSLTSDSPKINFFDEQYKYSIHFSINPLKLFLSFPSLSRQNFKNYFSVFSLAYSKIIPLNILMLQNLANTDNVNFLIQHNEENITKEDIQKDMNFAYEFFSNKEISNPDEPIFTENVIQECYSYIMNKKLQTSLDQKNKTSQNKI